MVNKYDHNLMMSVYKAHQQEELDAAYRHHLVRQARQGRPTLLQRIQGFRSALNINLRAQIAHECTLNPAAC